MLPVTTFEIPSDCCFVNQNIQLFVQIIYLVSFFINMSLLEEEILMLLEISEYSSAGQLFGSDSDNDPEFVSYDF